eukprot:s3308_g6.t2
MSVASEPSLAVGPTTAQVAPAPPPVPVFSDDEPLCILQLRLVGPEGGQGKELDVAVLLPTTTRCQVDYGGTGISLSGCVVEILNAYSSGRSARSDTLEVLRAVAAAQALHTKAIDESRVSMEGLQSEMDRLEGEWTKACAGAKKRHRGLLQRFALVLQAKIDKERKLHEEIQVRRWNQQGAVAAAAAPTPAAAEEGDPWRSEGVVAGAVVEEGAVEGDEGRQLCWKGSGHGAPEETSAPGTRWMMHPRRRAARPAALRVRYPLALSRRAS